MNAVAALVISSLVWLAVLAAGGGVLFYRMFVTKARRFAVTLKQNEGAFVALRTEKRWDRWVFEDVKILPNNPGGPVVAAAPGRLHVPRRNILYYQEIQETANATK